ncbi:MAG: hypothetical protein JOZ62_22030, partial [Acidobacteriaceae bacterium]|nr:hypothetical protein [Acidobacteriaceae bacterium]
LAMGNRLVYQDTYEQALSQLIAELGGTAPPQPQPNQPAPPQTAGAPQAAPSVQQPSNQAVQTLQQIRDHLRRYRELSSQGKWADAGKELDAIQSLVQR